MLLTIVVIPAIYFHTPSFSPKSIAFFSYSISLQFSTHFSSPFSELEHSILPNFFFSYSQFLASLLDSHPLPVFEPQSLFFNPSQPFIPVLWYFAVPDRKVLKDQIYSKFMSTFCFKQRPGIFRKQPISLTFLFLSSGF
jgi:hypothetical protein